MNSMENMSVEKKPRSVIDVNNEKNQKMIERYTDVAIQHVTEKMEEIMGKFGRGEINKEEFLNAKQEVIESVNNCFKTAADGMEEKIEDQNAERGI